VAQRSTPQRDADTQSQKRVQSACQWDADERNCRNRYADAHKWRATRRDGEGERDGQKAEGAPKATKANPFVAAGMGRFVG
jgi:hypothetical protein